MIGCWLIFQVLLTLGILITGRCFLVSFYGIFGYEGLKGCLIIEYHPTNTINQFVKDVEVVKKLILKDGPSKLKGENLIRQCKSKFGCVKLGADNTVKRNPGRASVGRVIHN